LLGFDVAHGKLVLGGKHVDEILEISDAVEFPNMDWKSGKRIMSKWQTHYSRSAIYPGGGRYKEAFWRLLSNDAIKSRTRGKNILDTPIHRRTELGEWRHTLDDYYQETTSWSQLPMSLVNRRFFVTKQGLLGLGPVETRVGDTIHVLFGGRYPFILRRVHGEGSGTYQHLGEGYIQGIMDGESVERYTEMEVVIWCFKR
jgi:hypothetical protein